MRLGKFPFHPICFDQKDFCFSYRSFQVVSKKVLKIESQFLEYSELKDILDWLVEILSSFVGFLPSFQRALSSPS